jgi:putative PIN family toxin of toxin-antitoxin system
VIVVFDSSIWVSALHFGGIPRHALKLGFVRDKTVVCDEIAAEVRRALTEKFAWTPTRVAHDFDRLIADAVRVSIRGTIRGVCRDPNDDMVLECAINSKADLIVTGDRDLLVLQAYRGVRIITGRQYLNEYSTTHHDKPAAG